jgi:DNA-binding CsgD family transcriptional regulator
VPAWAGESEDQVLHHTCGPRRLLDGGPRPGLTGRELVVAKLVAQGLTNQSIARRLSIAPRTAEAHAENIRRKLQARSRAQIAAWVTEHRLGRETPR